MTTKITKKCSACKELKSFDDDFGIDRSRKDGKCPQCKACRKAYGQSLQGQITRQVWLGSGGEELMRQHNQTERGKEANRRSARAYRKRHPLRIKAVSDINVAVRTGRIPRPSEMPCAMNCGKRAAHYHHDDYTKPLQATALCAPCHREVHKR